MTYDELLEIQKRASDGAALKDSIARLESAIGSVEERWGKYGDHIEGTLRVTYSVISAAELKQAILDILNNKLASTKKAFEEF